MSAAATLELETARSRHLELLLRGDRKTALREATKLIETGIPLEDVVLGVLAPVQAEIGRRWQEGEITHEDEAVATEVADILLTVAAARRPHHPTGANLVMCVADHEHHNLPARMVAELLRDAGHSVMFLGSPRPRPQLADLIRHAAPDAVVISCSLGMNLPGVVGLAGIAHSAGVPVVVGGAAFAGRNGRATRVGGDELALRVGEVAELVAARPAGAELSRGPDGMRAIEWTTLVRERRRIAVEVAERMLWFSAAVVPRNLRTPRALSDHINNLLAFVEAAALVDDEVLIDYARWLQSHMLAQCAEPEFTPQLLATVRDQIEPSAPTAALATDAAVATLGAPPPRS